jgi:hypothetical protein
VNSPLGWVRANLIYDTLKTPPLIGSPLEVICIAVFTARQRAKYTEMLCSLQPHLTKENVDAVKKLLDAYEQELFPFKEKKEWDDKKQITEIMEKEMQRGPIVVQGQASTKRVSKKS